MPSETSIERQVPAEKQLEVGTWGVFFLWIGIALLAHLAWGMWMLGVGVIILGAQLARRLLIHRIETFWIVAGLVFVLGGASQLTSVGLSVPLIPLICILAGASLLAKVLIQRTRTRHA